MKTDLKTRERVKRYYAEHRDEKRQYQREYHQRNRVARLAYAAQYRDAHRQELREWQKTYRVANKAEKQSLWNQRSRECQQRLRIEVLARYGGKCGCCGEAEPQFLAIDHVAGGGNQHRKQVGRGAKFYLWLKRNAFPDGFRVLCHNCNMARGYYGSCPHESKVRAAMLRSLMRSV